MYANYSISCKENGYLQLGLNYRETENYKE